MREMISRIFDHMKHTKRNKRELVAFESLTEMVYEWLGIKPKTEPEELVEELFKARRTILEIVLLIRYSIHPDRMLHVDADAFWERKGRNTFVNEAAVLLTNPAIRELYARVHRVRTGDGAVADFLAGLDPSIRGNMGMFLYEQITKEKSLARRARRFVKLADI